MADSDRLQIILSMPGNAPGDNGSSSSRFADVDQVEIVPGLTGIQPLSGSFPVAIAQEQFLDFKAPIVSKLNPVAGVLMAYQDGLQYRTVALQIITGAGVSAGVLSFEGSSDGNAWVAVQLIDSAATSSVGVTSLTLAASANRFFVGPIFFERFRVRVSTTVAGGQVSCLATYRMTSAPFATSVANIAQWGGTAVVTGGVSGLPGVGGNVAVGSTPTANPVTVGGVDYDSKIRRTISDAYGHQVVVGADPARTGSMNPILVSESESCGRFNSTELLELILDELRLQSFYLKELPLMLSRPDGFFTETLGNFDSQLNRTTQQ
jgi:hypothetical protein